MTSVRRLRIDLRAGTSSNGVKVEHLRSIEWIRTRLKDDVIAGN
jgi:hypothetical protein